MLNKLKLRDRLFLLIGFTVLISLAATISFVGYRSNQLATRQAYEKAEEMAYRYGHEVKMDVEGTLDAARTMAEALQGIKIDGHINRDMVISIMRNILQQNPFFLGTWTCWEPNAFDGQDAEFINKEGHDSTGRFVPYIYKSGSSLGMDALVDYETPGAGDYYLIPRNSGEEIIVDPYEYEIDGKTVLLTSLCVPIKVNGTVVGVAGIDIKLDKFHDLIKNIKPYGTGFAVLLSNTGTYVAHPAKKIIGQKMTREGVHNGILNSVAAGQQHTAFVKPEGQKSTFYSIFVPVTFGQTKTPWAIGIGIPLDAIRKDSTEIVGYSVLIGIIAILAVFAVIFFIASNITAAINRVIKDLSKGSDQIYSAANQVASSSQQLAQGANEQASSLEETSASLEQLNSMTQRNTTNTKETENLVTDANHLVKDSQQAMVQLSGALEDMKNSSDETSKIIKTIDEIAFQTNLLALNAAVEAARAGEAGKGFAVVAEEVRNLAQRSAEAAKNTSGLIEKSIVSSENGVTLGSQASTALEKIVESIDKITVLTKEIYTASDEQSKGIGQINTAVAQMNQVTQSNASNSEESAAASEELSSQARELNTVVEILVDIVNGAGSNQ